MFQQDDSMKTVKIQVVKDYKLHDEAIVKLSKQGERHAETVWVERKFSGGTIKKLDKERYVVMKSGEIKEFKHKDEKAIPDLLRTFARLKAIIRTNFTESGSNQLFLTLTYRDNMMDAKRLYDDYDKFMKRLRYAYSDHNLEYMAVAEPQERGAWHMHVMIKSDRPVLYIDQVKLDDIWRHGSTTAERLKSDDIGQYYVTYFTDMMESNEQNEKKRKKRSRLHLYPTNFKFYRTSKGIKQPEVSTAEWKEVQKLYGKPVYETTYKLMDFSVIDGVEQPIQTIHKASFRRPSESN